MTAEDARIISCGEVGRQTIFLPFIMRRIFRQIRKAAKLGSYRAYIYDGEYHTIPIVDREAIESRLKEFGYITYGQGTLFIEWEHEDK